MLVMVWSTTSGGKHHSWLYFNGSVVSGVHVCGQECRARSEIHFFGMKGQHYVFIVCLKT